MVSLFYLFIFQTLLYEKQYDKSRQQKKLKTLVSTYKQFII